MQNSCGRVPRQGAPLQVGEEVVLWPCLPSLPQPGADVEDRLRPEEPHAILPALAASHLKRPGGAMHILDAEAEGFADAEPAVGQQGDERPVPTALQSVRARGQEPAYGIIVRDPRKILRDL